MHEFRKNDNSKRCEIGRSVVLAAKRNNLFVVESVCEDIRQYIRGAGRTAEWFQTTQIATNLAVDISRLVK